MKPSAPVSIPHFDKINRPVVFIGPIVVFHVSYSSIHQNYAAGAKQWHHAPVGRANVPIPMAGISVGEHSFETPPLFDHPGKQFGSLGIECGIESHRGPETDGGGRQVRLRSKERGAIGKAVLNRNVVPAEYVEWIQVVN